jgi:hypothetical protein
VITHADVALEALVLACELLGALVQLRFAERRDTLIADSRLRDTDLLRDGVLHECVHGLVPETREHLLFLMIIRTYVPTSESVQRREKGRRRVGGRKLPGVCARARESGADARNGNGMTQGDHGRVRRERGVQTSRVQRGGRVYGLAAFTESITEPLRPLSTHT